MNSWGLALLSLGGVFLMATSLNDEFNIYYYIGPVVIMICGLVLAFRKKGGKENESN